MVDALHAAGFEVVLDVVFNHTAEAGPAAPRCLTAASTTPLLPPRPEDPGRYIDTSGTRQFAQCRRPDPLRMIMDSLRYWVTDDGRRRLSFRPRTDPGQKDGAFDPFSAFFDLVGQDPVIVTGQADRRAVGCRQH